MSDLRGAIAPLVAAIGATVVDLDDATDGDLVLEWNGRPELAIRLDMGRAVAGMIRSVEVEFGATLNELDRTGKQAAVRILEERGAFSIRHAMEDVADSMGMSRITIYNYLNAIRDS